MKRIFERQFLILLVLLAVLIAGASFSYCAFAYAADEPVPFVISTDDGEDWSLSLDGSELLSASGKFFQPEIGNDAVSAKFFAKILEVLESDGRDEDDFSVEFEFPSIDRVVQGNTLLAYSQTESGLKIFADGNFIIGGARYLEYAKVGEEYAVYDYAEFSNGGFAFGKNVPVGDLLVRVVYEEKFDYPSGVWHSVKRVSSPVSCSVVKATPANPSVETIIPYGTKAKDIKNFISFAGGTFELSEQEGISGETVLGVSESPHSILFDFIPNNENYKTLAGTPVSVEVEPMPVSIFISDACSLVGENIDISRVSFELASPLVAGDELSGLGVQLSVNADKNLPGIYAIVAKFENANYVPISQNYTDPFVKGGCYTVYANKLTCIADDGREFAILVSEVNFDWHIVIKRIETESPNGYLLVGAYSVGIFDAAGNRIVPEKGFGLAFDASGISHTAVLSEEGEIVGDIVPATGQVQMSVGCDKVLLLSKVEPSPITPAVISLIVLCAVFAVALAVLLGIYFGRRGYFR